MDVSKFFNSTSRYLRASDLNGPRVVTVAGWSVEKLSGREKLLLHFRERELAGKALVVNRSNGQTLKRLFGTTNADDWTGKRVVLYVDSEVEFNGAPRGGIRIRAADNVSAGEEREVSEPSSRLEGVGGGRSETRIESWMEDESRSESRGDSETQSWAEGVIEPHGESSSDTPVEGK